MYFDVIEPVYKDHLRTTCLIPKLVAIYRCYCLNPLPRSPYFNGLFKIRNAYFAQLSLTCIHTVDDDHIIDIGRQRQ